MNALSNSPPGITIVFSLLLSACATTTDYTLPDTPYVPATWQQDTAHQPVQAGWLAALNDPQLVKLVNEAIRNNPQLATQRALLDQAKQQLIISGAPRIPELSAALSASRRQIQTATTRTTSQNLELTLNLNWEIDIWGKLKDTQKQAALIFAAKKAELDMAQLQLVAETSNAWYDVLEAQTLLVLYKSRLNNLQRNLDIIEAGYRQGLNPALDIYLTRNDLQQETARISAQQQLTSNTVRRLQLLLGRYPDGQAFPPQALPLIAGNIPAGLPSELINRRPGLHRDWLELLAADTGIAIAHKQRFPHLSITGSSGQSSTELRNLLQTNQGVWSLVGGLLQPLFNAGELAAREEEARTRLRQLEQQYQASVLQAFAEVETALTQEAALESQYQQYLRAEENARTAETISFEQYQRGLVNYATVLESQRRAFDAQSAVIQLQRQQLNNRIALHVALGGSFDETAL